ncbi:hypothetical protein ACFQU1_20250 [Chelatococcus sp. GCM10030263]|uniref:hypothetical protein n=1 Tax=Chelatococcus sp. GCM10030263 TaxID=3273387 RepID=UPI0036210908
MGIDISRIEDHPANVRAWVFQLLAMEANKSKSNWEIIRLGMSDPSIEARRGLAVGLLGNFIDIFEVLILDWLVNEPELEIRQLLIEHLIRNADMSANYEKYAIELYEAEAPGSSLRQRMEASAVRTPLYTRFKQIDAGPFGDLFGERSTIVVEKQYNIGSIQGGAINVGDGQSTNHGPTQSHWLNDQRSQEIQADLEKLKATLIELEIDPSQKEKALTYVAAAKQNPSKERLQTVIDFVDQLTGLAESTKKLAPYVLMLRSYFGV